jgi:gas vesicle protein
LVKTGEKKMKFIIGFIWGAIVGAAVALLYAPSTGEELRANIKTQADTQAARLQDEWQKGMSELQDRMDKINSDLQALSGKAEEGGTPTD